MSFNVIEYQKARRGNEETIAIKKIRRNNLCIFDMA